MARRTKEDAAVTREQLLDAAERVFRAQGAARTSLAEVAAAAGVTRGAVYWHFRDKSDLFSAMCERAQLPLETSLERVATTPQENPLRALEAQMVVPLTRLATDPRAQAVFEVLCDRGQLTADLAPIGQRCQRERSACLSHVEQLLQQAVDAGQLPSDTDTALATRALHGFISGLMREWVADRNAYDLAAVAPAFVAMMIGGLCANPPRRAERVRPRVRARTTARV